MPARLALSVTGEPFSAIRKRLFWQRERFPCAFWLRRREAAMLSTVRPKRAWSARDFLTFDSGIDDDS
jgi:hypothetical protein